VRNWLSPFVAGMELGNLPNPLVGNPERFCKIRSAASPPMPGVFFVGVVSFPAQLIAAIVTELTTCVDHLPVFATIAMSICAARLTETYPRGSARIEVAPFQSEPGGLTPCSG